MALEVRSVPPRAVLVLLLAALSFFSLPSQAQETRAPAENLDAVEAKARLLQELDQQIEQRRRQIAREEEALVALKRALEAAKQALAEERDRLEELKRAVEADIARRETIVDQRLQQISKVYAAMKPREAALALEGMDDDMAADILDGLPGRTVGKIFNLMSKERVRELTRRLESGRLDPRGEAAE
jgi:flagellar motility protein MotE (MotC chaperone)